MKQVEFVLSVCWWCLGLTQFDLSDAELERLQNRKWQLATSAVTRIHPSSSEPSLGAVGRGEGGGCEGGGAERGSETTVRDAFQHLRLTIVEKPLPKCGEF